MPLSTVVVYYILEFLSVVLYLELCRVVPYAQVLLSCTVGQSVVVLYCILLWCFNVPCSVVVLYCALDCCSFLYCALEFCGVLLCPRVLWCFTVH